MHLAAVWFHRHFLFNDTSFNFGGKHFYDFNLKDKVLTISRAENHRWIDNFFAEDSPNLTLLSAIVGSNGSGKTTLLKDIIAGATESQYPQGILLVFESSNGSVCLLNNTKLSIQSGGFTISECTPKIETVFYAPFFEASKFYQEYGSSNIDISTDRLLYFDKESNESKEDSDAILEHSYQNTYRRFDFLRTSFAKSLYKYFNLPSIEKSRLSFRSSNYPPNIFNNTPTAFIPFIEKLIKIWRAEIHAISDEERLGKAKLWFLRKLMNSIFAPLEATNHFLEEGRVSMQGSNELDGLPLKEALEKFLDSHSFIESQHNRRPNATLPTQQIKDLINTCFETIDTLPTTSFKNRHNIEIELDFEAARKILEAEKTFLNSMTTFKDAPIGFIDAEPDIELSTGEKALLDLFSRFNFAIELIEKKKRDEEYNQDFPKHFILFLDEGDITFHPKWLKMYVNRIVEVLPKMFEEKFKDSTVQIIITTHSPFILSDLPKENVIFLKKGEDGKCQVVEGMNDMKQTFGANIHTLLSDGFFMDGLMGDFAKGKIDKVIRYLNRELNPGETMTEDEAVKIIDMIGEPILKRHLQQQIQYRKNDKRDEQIAELKKRIEKLENEKNPKP